MKILILSAQAEPDTPSYQLAFNQKFRDVHSFARNSGPYKIATEMRKLGHIVEVADFIYYWPEDKIKQYLNERVPHVDILAWSAQFFYNFEFYQKWSLYIKTINPNIIFITGGPKVNNLLNFTNSKYLIAGYAEHAIKDLLDHIEGKSKKLKFKIVNDQYYIDCFEFYPMTDDVSLETIHHASDCIAPGETLTLGTTRGCMFKCNFCTYPYTGKKKDRFNRTLVSSYYDELMRNYESWGTTSYYLPDDTANDSIDKLRILEKAADKLPFKLDITGFARLELLDKHRKYWEVYKNTGFMHWHLGIETFNPKSLKALGKGYDPKKLQKVLLDLRDYFKDDAVIYASFMIGAPEDSPELYEKLTLDWLRGEGKDALTGKVFFPMNILVENPYSIGSEFTRNYQSHGYRTMTAEEIAYEKTIDPTVTDEHIKETAKYTVMWANRDWNIISADRFSKYCHSSVVWNNNLSPWYRARGLSVGMTHKEILSLCKNTNQRFIQTFSEKVKISLDNYINLKLQKNWFID